MAKKSIASNTSKVKLSFTPSAKRRGEYQQTYNRLMVRAQGRLYEKGVHERHHIEPRSLGGSDENSNIAILTFREHFLAHWLLTRIHEGVLKQKMCAALYFMTISPDHYKSRIVTGWQFTLSKIAKALSRQGQTPTKGYKHTIRAKETIRKKLMRNKNSVGSFWSFERRKAYSKSREGAGNPRTSITQEIAIYIYTTTEKYLTLAKIFGIHENTVGQIKRRSRWNCIHPILGWDYNNNCWEKNK